MLTTNRERYIMKITLKNIYSRMTETYQACEFGDTGFSHYDGNEDLGIHETIARSIYTKDNLKVKDVLTVKVLGDFFIIKSRSKVLVRMKDVDLTTMMKKIKEVSEIYGLNLQTK